MAVTQTLVHSLTERFGEAGAREIVFHLNEAIDGIRLLLEMDSNPARFSSEQILAGVSNFLVHVPNHLAIAALIVRDPVQVMFDRSLTGLKTIHDNPPKGNPADSGLKGSNTHGITQALTGRYGVFKAREIAFHLHDWIGNAEDLILIYHSPDRFSSKYILGKIVGFLVHAPYHVAEAAWIAGVPIKRIFYRPKLSGRFDDEGQSKPGGHAAYHPSFRYR